MKKSMQQLNRDQWDIYLKYIVRLAKTDLQHKGFPVQKFEDSELWQEAWTALSRAKEKFDPEKAALTGAKFSTYAHKFVFHEIRKYMFRQAQIAMMEHGHQDIASISVRDFVPDKDNNGISVVDRQDLLCHAMHILSDDEIQMLTLYYVDGLSYREIEEIMEISYTTVRNKMKGCLDKIKKRIKSEDEDYRGY